MKTATDTPRQSLARPLLMRAAILTLTFLILHLLGLRQYTSVLSGTATFSVVKQALGATYGVIYALFITLTPILLIAAALAKGLRLQ